MKLPAAVLGLLEPALLGPNVIALPTASGESSVAPFVVTGELAASGQAGPVLAACLVLFGSGSILVFR